MSGITPNNTTKQIINNAIVKKLNNLETEVNTLEEGVVTVQDDISDVQNDIQDIQGNIETIQGNISDLNGSVTDINAALEGKQSTLTFDNEPRTGSNNPVKSGGIYDALETKLDKESVKFDPEPNGTDALSTGGAYDIVQDLTEQLNDYKRNVVVQTTDADGVKKNLGAIIIDNQNEVETDKAIVVENGGTELKDTNVDGDLTSSTLAVENDATIGGNATVDGNVTSNEFIGGLEKSISITDENNTTHTFNNTDNVSLSGVLKAQKDINGDSIDSTYVKNATKGVANGIATLDENGRLPYSQLPESAMELKGLWDASTNTPTLVQGVGTNGDFYIVSVGGTQFGETFNVNDRIVFVSDDDTWHRLPYTITSPVTSVNNKIGAVTLYGTDIQKSNSDSETITHALDNILNKVYPIGSLYWSSQSTDPSTLFGGTWVQIKDRFVWAKGDSDTVNATGGAKTVTLAVANLPSHNHSFTPSGSISGGAYTFSGTSATTSSNGSHTHTTNSQSASTTGNQSANPSYSWTGSHSHNFAYGEMLPSSGSSFNYLKFLKSADSGLSLLSDQLNFKYSNSTYYTSYGTIGKYTISSYQPSTESGNAKYLSGYSTPNYDREYGNGSKLLYNKDTSITVSGTTTGNHTHSYSHTHGTDSQGAHTHTLTATGTISVKTNPTFTGTANNTGNTGSGTAVDKMPPYIVKYCWERTA